MIHKNLDLALLCVNSGVSFVELAKDLGIEEKQLLRALRARELEAGEIYKLEQSINRLKNERRIQTHEQT